MTDHPHAPPGIDNEGRAPHHQDPADNVEGPRHHTNDNESSAGAQVPPVGSHPDVAVLLVGALLWATLRRAADVFGLVDDDDLADPALACVFNAMRNLAAAGRALGPQLVLGELRRTAALRGHVPDRLREATTSGALPEAALEYAAAVVAEALRRRIESAGAALSAAAMTAAEDDLAPLVAQAAASVSDCAQRLAVLRGERYE
jgi:replicative DNA helicase